MIVARFEKHFIPEPNGGCWLWTASVLPTGYGRFSVGGESRRAHRVAWNIYHGPIPPDLCVLHKCDVRCCVNPDHLFLGTHSENALDMFAKGRGHRRDGEHHPRAKLTWEDISHIRNCNAPSRQIARAYEVAHTTINYLKLGKTWKPEDLNNE